MQTQATLPLIFATQVECIRATDDFIRGQLYPVRVRNNGRSTTVSVTCGNIHRTFTLDDAVLHFRGTEFHCPSN